MRDTEAQIRAIDAILHSVGDRDVQGVARLMSTRRGLVADLHDELERRRTADTSGATTQLEERLTEALSLIDDARLRRVLLEVERRKGVTLSDWLRDG